MKQIPNWKKSVVALSLTLMGTLVFFQNAVQMKRDDYTAWGKALEKVDEKLAETHLVCQSLDPEWDFKLEIHEGELGSVANLAFRDSDTPLNWTKNLRKELLPDGSVSYSDGDLSLLVYSISKFQGEVDQLQARSVANFRYNSSSLLIDSSLDCFLQSR